MHFSTDYVFPGGVRPLREDDPTGPVNAYGRSKLAGEHSLHATGCRQLLLRCSWVYGARGKNFLRTMLRLARARESLSVVNDQRGAPTSARLIAATVAAMLVRIAAAPVQSRLMGTYHLAAAGETTWHGFATEIVGLAARAGLVPRAIPVEPIPSRDYPSPAPPARTIRCSTAASSRAISASNAGLARGPGTASPNSPTRTRNAWVR